MNDHLWLFYWREVGFDLGSVQRVWELAASHSDLKDTSTTGIVLADEYGSRRHVNARERACAQNRLDTRSLRIPGIYFFIVVFLAYGNGIV